MGRVRAYCRVNWEAPNRMPLPPRWHIEERPIQSLRLHETPSKRGIDYWASEMCAGEPIPIISVAQDGMILDGHHRAKAAARVLGKDASIPVAVHEVHYG